MHFQASTEHITENALETFLDLAKHFNNLPSGVQLLRHLVDHILFNPALWIHTPTKVTLVILVCFRRWVVEPLGKLVGEGDGGVGVEVSSCHV